MFPSVLQRDTSAHRLSYPRLVHCDITFQPGPKPVPIPRLPPPTLLTPANNTPQLDYSIEQQVIDDTRQRQLRQQEATQQYNRRLQQEERRRREEAEAEARNRAEVVAERQRKEEADRKEVDGNRKRHEVEQEKLRHIEEAYKKQRAAVEAFSNKTYTPAANSTAALPVAPPVNRSGRPSVAHPLLFTSQPSMAAGASGMRSVNTSAVSSFQSITGVSDVASATLLMSLLDSDVDVAVNVYFSDPGQADIHAAIDKAITLQERKQQQR